MRLIQTTKLELHEFYSDIPEYVILSHTWQKGEEISLQELEADLSKSKTGWNKIRKLCELARGKKYLWAWIDTCCIDKTSSVELSEAINSMYQWYQNASLCYAYLADVNEDWRISGFLKILSEKPFWFTRGWTLQELIAPRNVVFLAADWTILGTKASLCKELSNLTGITVEVLLQPQLLSSMSIARRMSWASVRKTTRPEDIAYCLMGMFDVNMPLLYGEGTSKAFIRLQEEIIKNSEDQSLFAWQHPKDISKDNNKLVSENEGIFAIHPFLFRDSINFSFHRKDHAPYKTTNRGLEIEIPIAVVLQHGQPDATSLIGILSCHDEDKWGYSIGVLLEQGFDRYYRKKDSTLVFLEHETVDSAEWRTVHIHKWGNRPTHGKCPQYCHLRRLHSGIQFSEGIVVEATVASTSHNGNIIWRPGELVSQWRDHRKSMLLSSSSDGSFIVLDFRIDHSLGQDLGILGGITVVIRVFSDDFRVMRLVPWTQEEREVPNFLYRVLDKYHSMTAFAREYLVVRGGQVRASLEKMNRWDLEAYVVDFDHHPFGLPTLGDTALGRTQTARPVEADNGKRRRL